VGATPFSSINAAFTAEVHQVAVDTLYPVMFGVDSSRLEFEDTLVGEGARETVLDGEMAIDCVAKVSASDPRFQEALTFTAQERWRHPGYRRFRDVTITEWNPASNLPSELYKITADLFVYGYYSRPFTVGTFLKLYEVLKTDSGICVCSLPKCVPALRMKKAIPELLQFGREHRLWYPRGAKGCESLDLTHKGRAFLRDKIAKSRQTGQITEAIMFNVAAAKLGICKGELAYKWPDVNSRSGQSFIGIDIDQLSKPPYGVYHFSCLDGRARQMRLDNIQAVA